MNKTLLLARSNLRKNRGTSVGLFLMMLIATCLVGISLLIFFDAYPTAQKKAEELNAGDGFITISGSLDGFTDEKIEELIGADTDDYYVYRDISYPTMTLPFGDGNAALTLAIDDESAFTRQMNRISVINEDTSITGSYVYLPYQFNTSGGFEIGDTYEYENYGKKYCFKVRGFTDVIYGGCNNNGIFAFVVDDDSYQKIRDEEKETAETIFIIYDLKDGVKNGAFRIRTSNEMLKVNPFAQLGGAELETMTGSRTFIGLIIAVSMLVLTSLLVVALAMMLANSISNYIRENMKTLGALKAIGYTGKDIKDSLVIWFFFIALLASAIGIVISYVCMPVFAGLVVGQMGLSYRISFNPLATFIPIGYVILFTVIVTLISSGKISRIQPIVALREGVESHNFKKNRMPLDKTSLSLNMSLAMKTLFTNMKQNVITFFAVGFMVFCCIISLLMYENFSRNPKLDIFATEICAGVIAGDGTEEDEMREYLDSRKDIINLREMLMMDFYYNDEVKLVSYVVEDPSLMRNQSVCYEGRLPKYDNEAAVSGSFAKAYGYEIGDEVKLDYGENSYNYLITGFIQTTNNMGREAILTYSGADHVVDMDQVPTWFWFDLENPSNDYAANSEVTNEIIGDCKDKYGSHIINTINFYEVMGGSMTTFRDISGFMLVVMIGIAVVVIALILYLLIKSLVYHKRKDYGIYKALGYTSGSLMLQTAVSFMPAIIASAVAFSIGSYYAANLYISAFMRAFGLMQVNFDIPVIGVVIIGIGLVIVSFELALMQTARIKKIEAYNMLVAE